MKKQITLLAICMMAVTSAWADSSITVKATNDATAVTVSEDDILYPVEGWDETKTYDITVKRTMKADQWNALTLSFPMTAAEVKSNFGSDVKLMKLTNMADNTIYFETVDLATDANTAIGVAEPCIVKPTADVTQITVTGKTGLKDYIDNPYFYVGKGEDATSCFSFWDIGEWEVVSFFCSYTEKSSGYSAYILNNDKFYAVDSEATVKGYSWDIAHATKVDLSISFDGKSTAINNVDADINANNSVIKTPNYIIKNGKKYNYAGQRLK